MLTVKEAKRKGLIKPAYHELIPDTCAITQDVYRGCGSELETNENLSVLRCSNPRCNIKVASRGAAMLDAFGVKGIGYKFCKRFIDSNGLHSHLSLFVAPLSMLENTGKISDANKLYKVIQTIKSYKYTFPTLVSNLRLPGMDTRAKDIFRGCSSLKDFYLLCDYLDVTPVEYIRAFEGYGDILAEQMVDVIETFKLELMSLPAIFKIKPESDVVMDIAVTGSITKLRLAVNRKDFGRYLNTIGEGYVHVNIGKSLASCKYIVADEPSGSSTYMAGIARERAELERYENDKARFERGEISKVKPLQRVLVTSDEMEAIVLKEVDRLKGGIDKCQDLSKLMSS